MAEYKLNKPDSKHSNCKGYITKDGHTMFNEDIVRELNKISKLDAKIRELKDELHELEKNYTY
jgi:hypothetical protein